MHLYNIKSGHLILSYHYIKSVLGTGWRPENRQYEGMKYTFCINLGSVEKCGCEPTPKLGLQLSRPS